MKALIEAKVYQPTLVLPMLSLMQLMVAHDFNVAIVSALLATQIVRFLARCAQTRVHSRQRDVLCGND
jgi:hypothetical protein